MHLRLRAAAPPHLRISSTSEEAALAAEAGTSEVPQTLVRRISTDHPEQWPVAPTAPAPAARRRRRAAPAGTEPSLSATTTLAPCASFAPQPGRGVSCRVVQDRSVDVLRADEGPSQRTADHPWGRRPRIDYQQHQVHLVQQGTAFGQRRPVDEAQVEPAAQPGESSRHTCRLEHRDQPFATAMRNVKKPGGAGGQYRYRIQSPGGHERCKASGRCGLASAIVGPGCGDDGDVAFGGRRQRTRQ